MLMTNCISLLARERKIFIQNNNNYISESAEREFSRCIKRQIAYAIERIRFVRLRNVFSRF